jgi:hypothetical protein
MVRYIYITKNTNIEPKISIISMEDFCNGKTSIEYNDVSFNDMTTNFDDLGIWDCEKNLVGMRTVDITRTIQVILSGLTARGYRARELTQKDEESYTIPRWMWGHNEQTGASAYSSYNLPVKERIEILMYHLTNILDICKNYDERYYAFLKN